MDRFEIIADPVAMTITVGEQVFQHPHLFHRPEYFFEIKEEICGVPQGVAREALSLKDINQFYCDRLGPKFNRRFQAANYHMWVAGRMQKSTADMLRHRGKNWRHYSNELVYRANLAIAHVNEAERDGLHHLIPAIVAFGASPQTIRQSIGGAAWRQIAHNSKTRNKKILQVIDATRGDERAWGDRFAMLLDFPSGVLSAVMSLGPDEIMAARITPKKTFAAFEATTHVVRDARRMLGGVNPEWSLARIEREHAAAVTAVRRKSFSGDAFASPWNFTKGGFSASLLTSPLAIAIEGDTQHHCVASFAAMAQHHNYAVVRIEGHQRATAGYRRAGKDWRLDQVYEACNVPVSSACREFAESLGRILPSNLAQAERRAA